jgi:hypothetical protein
MLGPYFAELLIGSVTDCEAIAVATIDEEFLFVAPFWDQRDRLPINQRGVFCRWGCVGPIRLAKRWCSASDEQKDICNTG